VYLPTADVGYRMARYRGLALIMKPVSLAFVAPGMAMEFA
jgi:hypothetical protein